MNTAGGPAVARRSILLWVLGAGAGIAVAAFEASRLFGSHHSASAYDDLLALLPDRDSAAIVGKAAAHLTPSSDGDAAALRRDLKQHGLTQLAVADAVADRLAEVHGWLLPDSLASLCVLAARSA
ncbi:MAG TPA: hypothetical protein VGF97_10605 [Rhizomicrobium sp.]|jgi:hypothetical protein